MLSSIYRKCITYIESRGFNNLTFDKKAHQKIISDIKTKLFQCDDLRSGEMSTLSILIRRSIAQFLGHKYWDDNIIDTLMRNTICILFIPILTIYYLLIPYLKHPNNNNSDRLIAVLITDSLDDLFVYPFMQVYPAKSIVVNGKMRQLTWHDFLFITNLIKCFHKIVLYPELLMRVIQRLSQYSYVIEKINCKTIVTMSAEGSPWASILTAYCRMNNVEHVQIMHGIRFFSSQMAFAEFDKYYIWGQLHLEEFKKMYVNASKFIIIGNPIHQQMFRDISSDESLRSYHKLLICFNYPIMTLDQMTLDIINVAKQFEKYGWQIGFRPHPRRIQESSSFLEKIEDAIMTKIIVDNPKKTSLLDSVINSDVIIASYTNALTDAWIAGKKCIYVYSPRIPLQEFHFSKNIKIYKTGDDLSDFILSPAVKDIDEWRLKNRFSYNFDSSKEVHEQGNKSI